MFLTIFKLFLPISDDTEKFERCIIKKTKYLLYMLWYVRSARKIYQKQGYKKSDFVWYTRDGKEAPMGINDATLNPATKSVIRIREYQEFQNFQNFHSFNAN